MKNKVGIYKKLLQSKLSRKDISLGLHFNNESWPCVFITKNGFAGSSPPVPWQYMYRTSFQDHWSFMHMKANDPVLNPKNIIGHPINLEDIIFNIKKLKSPITPMLQSRAIKLWTFGKDIFGQTDECILFLHSLFLKNA